MPLTPSDKSIEKGFKETRQITRKHAKSFYFASQVLSAQERLAVYSIYAICRLSVLAMKEMYAGILDSIEKNNYDMFSKRPHLNAFNKTAIFLKCLAKAKSHENRLS